MELAVPTGLEPVPSRETTGRSSLWTTVLDLFWIHHSEILLMYRNGIEGQKMMQKKSETVVFASDFIIEDVISIYNLEVALVAKIHLRISDLYRYVLA